MSNLQPPPTFANPVDKTTGSFSPIWLQWFLDYAQLSNSNSTQTSTIVSEINTLNTEVGTLQGDVTTINGEITTLQGNVTTINGEITTIQNFTTGYTHPVTTQTLTTGQTYTNATTYNEMIIVPTLGVTALALARSSSTYVTLTTIPIGFVTFTLSPNDSITVTLSAGSTTLQVVPV